MAGFLSSSLSTLPSASQDLLKGRHPKKSASCRISSLAASKRGILNASTTCSSGVSTMVQLLMR
ncbi:hypothetical protein SLEP1_g10834 [Rubroshorea leprosula]|uniref:Uncharacterized protein n=1 Tax=Rubroshorea leprosula TaxID=152421 RepID=A0AAV5IF64_9ROSI|nr:hypothetical protein SLEP1_g10834 [Rubroshorea leprosula]